MKVLYFTRDYTPHDHRFLTALAETEHEITALRLERRGMQREDRPLPANVAQVIWRGGQSPFRWQHMMDYTADLKRVVHDVRPDVIHAGPIPMTAFLAAAAGAAPLVSMSWGSDLLLDTQKSKITRWRARYALHRTQVMVGDCEAVRQQAIELDFPAERVVLFPWGVDLERFAPRDLAAAKAALGWQDEFVLLSLRSWEPLYGVDLLVRAFIRAAVDIPALRLILLGGGSQAGQIHQLINQAGMRDRIFLGGQVTNDELPRFYGAADLYLSASHSDGSSVSLMEALACGRPVCVSDIPGNREWITPAQQGWIFADGDETALAAMIREAYERRSELPCMGGAARALAEERANWKKNFQHLLTAYEMAAAG